MKKPYELHEIEYRRMREKGILSWGERDTDHPAPIDPDSERFLTDVLSQPWAPRKGKVIELGCGTAPILRWVCRKGFKGLGVDVSKTAIAMAREQSQGVPVRFRRLDLCASLPVKPASFDLAIDGHCLHCIITDRDRTAFLENVRRLLRPGGLFIIMTMASPVHRKGFGEVTPKGKVVGQVLYSPFKDAQGVEGWRDIEGKAYVPVRRVPHWKQIRREILRAGFRVQMMRINCGIPSDPCTDFSAAAIKD